MDRRPQFTDDNAACRVFSQTRIVDAPQQTEGIFALSCTTAPRSMRCSTRRMYSNSFFDLDGHHWEVLWMDPAVVRK